MVISPIVGVYIPIIRIPIKGGMTITNIATFDHGTYKYLYAQLTQLDVFCKVSRPKELCIQQVANIELQKTTDVWVSPQAHYRMA